MSELMIVILIGLVILYWQAAVRCKELAILGARKECQLCDVQLLDQTVHQIKVSLSRDVSGQWRIWREYAFDYTHDGEHRLGGRLTLLGQRVIRVALETFNPVIH
ncbi:MAG: DUF3301 domain-containing protein [Proteobacteria bacterium]|nr:DUF3301 domain-containing protein [Pseudomonadota bacterium]